jgi:NAD(P)-dependent dehydrogenase (short-subunit alcohol dehydrogenase family)
VSESATTVVITGAFGALGTAVARRFAGRGMRLGLLGREPVADVTRWVEPDAIADVVVFLASQAARAVNGAAVRVFGHG